MKFIKQLANRLTMKPVVTAALAMLSLLTAGVSTQAAEIKADQYQAFYGDINGDGLHDIYLAPKPKYIPIATDVMIIIPLPGDGDSYKLLAQASGYAAPELDNSIDTNRLNAGHFQILSGDFNGDGLDDIFIQSTSQSLLSLTLANTLLDPPYILQSFASFSSDTHDLTIGDINNDGRDDITYTVNNQKQTLYASNKGHLNSNGQVQVTANYGYDYLNKRRYKVVEQIGELRKEVLYIDDNTELRDGKLQKYITLGGQKIARSSQAGGEFAPTEFYLNNHLGSIALTLDASAHVKNAFTYEPYGDKQIAYGETERSPYGFTGKEQDPETQLGYFHHRYLNTQIGQFITPDPVFAIDNRFTDPQAWSPYAYARNNPITYTDPDGRVFGTFMGNNKNVGWDVSMQAGSYGNAAVETGLTAADAITTVTGVGGLVKETGKFVLKGALKKGADDVIEQGTKHFADEDFYRAVVSSSKGIIPRKLKAEDFPIVSGKISQKQNRHLKGNKNHTHGGYMDSQKDAQSVLDAFNGNKSIILGKSDKGFPVVKVNSVSGTNVNRGAGIFDQKTNIFMIKGTKSPSVVPMNPNWAPRQ